MYKTQIEDSYFISLERHGRLSNSCVYLTTELFTAH